MLAAFCISVVCGHLKDLLGPKTSEISYVNLQGDVAKGIYIHMKQTK